MMYNAGGKFVTSINEVSSLCFVGREIIGKGSLARSLKLIGDRWQRLHSLTPDSQPYYLVAVYQN